MKNKGWMAVIALAVIAFIPLITQNHIYTGIVTRSDYTSFVAKIIAYANQQVVTPLYPAEVIVGHSLGWLASVTHIAAATIYIWFAFLSLLATGATLYLFGSLFGKRGAWITLIVSLISTTGILILFSYGIIASILNMYVLLLLGIYFAIKWLDDGKRWQLVCSLVIFAFFSLYHLSALYLPYMIAVMLAMLLVLKWRKRKNLAKPLYLLTAVLLINLVVTGLTLNVGVSAFILRMVSGNIGALFSGGAMTQVNSSPLSTENFLVYGLGWSTVGLAIITLVMTPMSYWRNLSRREQAILFVLSGMTAPLYVGAFTALSPDSMRSALDASTITAILVAVLFTKAIERDGWLLRVGGYTFIGVGSLINALIWVAR